MARRPTGDPRASCRPDTGPGPGRIARWKHPGKFRPSRSAPDDPQTTGGMVPTGPQNPHTAGAMVDPDPQRVWAPGWPLPCPNSLSLCLLQPQVSSPPLQQCHTPSHPSACTPCPVHAPPASEWLTPLNISFGSVLTCQGDPDPLM